MRKVLTSLIVTAALCAPGPALANHTAIDPMLMDMMFETQEDCEDALAMERQSNRADQNYAPGRERGQYNKAFNARYDCEYDDQSDTYMIVDNNA